MNKKYKSIIKEIDEIHNIRRKLNIYEKSGNAVRIIRFKNPKDSNNYLDSFKSMRYLGYNGRYC